MGSHDLMIILKGSYLRQLTFFRNRFAGDSSGSERSGEVEVWVVEAGVLSPELYLKSDPQPVPLLSRPLLLLTLLLFLFLPRVCL